MFTKGYFIRRPDTGGCDARHNIAIIAKTPVITGIEIGRSGDLGIG